ANLRTPSAFTEVIEVSRREWEMGVWIALEGQSLVPQRRVFLKGEIDREDWSPAIESVARVRIQGLGLRPSRPSACPESPRKENPRTRANTQQRRWSKM